MRNNPLFRPPAEADSLILQTDTGCPHNRCTFCGMYRGVSFRRRTLDDVRSLIQEEARRRPGATRIFLADGDVMQRPFEELREILLLLKAQFPQLARVNLYANGQSIARRSDEELRALHSLKLHTLYMGLESGDEAVLTRCRKGETADQMVQAGQRAQAAGLRMSVMILLGLGGSLHSRDHAEHTAAALNRMQPRLLSALRVVPIPGTELHRECEEGRFVELTEWETVWELRTIVAGLEMKNTVFRANHSSNLIPLEARLPRDQARLMARLDASLASSEWDRSAPAKRTLAL